MGEPKPGEIYTTGVSSYKILYPLRKYGRDGGVAVPHPPRRFGSYARWVATDWPTRKVEPAAPLVEPVEPAPQQRRQPIRNVALPDFAGGVVMQRRARLVSRTPLTRKETT